MVNYDNIRGAGYVRYDRDADEPTVETEGASIDEMYFDRGKMYISFDAEGEHHRLKIPILPVDKWDKFVASLPTWNGD